MASLIAGVMYCEFQDQGWSERHFIKGADSLQAALPIMQNIVFGRTAFFGGGVTVLFARVSSTNPAHDGLACELDYPLGPHPSWGRGASIPLPDRLDVPEDPFTAVQMRFETAGGKFFQRYIRGIPDTYIENKVLKYPTYFKPWPDLNNIPNLSPVGGASHLQVCQGFWAYLLKNTYYAHKVAPDNYVTNDLAYVVFRQITKKSTGRPFGVSRGRRPKTVVG